MPHPSRLVEITCATCGKIKSIPLSQHKRCKSGRYFCSPDCRWIGLSTKRKIKCAYCDKEFICEGYRAEKFENVFCSRECQGLFNQKRQVVNCFQCGKELVLCPSQIESYEKKFCSSRCYGDWRSENLAGENCPWWKGGYQSCEGVLYPSVFNNYLKRKIRKRDNYTCQECGKQKVSRLLCVHHIDYDKMNNMEDNLISLCGSCHAKTNCNRNFWQQRFTDKLKSY